MYFAPTAASATPLMEPSAASVSIGAFFVTVTTTGGTSAWLGSKDAAKRVRIAGEIFENAEREKSGKCMNVHKCAI